MSDMRCPFCQTELEVNDLDVQLLGCENQNCKHSTHYDVVGTKELWEALIQAKQDLEVTRRALKEYANKDNWGCIEDDRDRFIHTYWYFDGCDDGGWVSAEKALEQIEHKETTNDK